MSNLDFFQHENVKEHIAKCLRRHNRRFNFPHKKIAKEVGIEPRTVAAHFNAQSAPDMATFARYVILFGLELADDYINTLGGSVIGHKEEESLPAMLRRCAELAETQAGGAL